MGWFGGSSLGRHLATAVERSVMGPLFFPSREISRSGREHVSDQTHGVTGATWIDGAEATAAS